VDINDGPGHCEPITGLLDWLRRPSPDHGIHFYEDEERWSFHSYADLAHAVRRGAAAIQAKHHRHGGSVALLLPTGPGFVAAFFGALLAGDTPCPLAPPEFLQDPVEYRRHVAQILATARPSLVVTSEQLEPVVGEALASAELSATPITTSLEGSDEPALMDAAGLALLQFTSGSSGSPRGARVTPDNLLANIEMIRRWLRLGEDDTVVSWLPLFHDMGLIGCLVTPMMVGADLYIMRPDQFIVSPQTWLSAFGHGNGTIGVSPGFGFAYACRHVGSEQLAGSDFSRWRVALVAAERIDPAVLGEFARLTGPYGFRTESFMPAYGLAEATLAVTGGKLGRRPPAVEVDWSRLRLGREVPLRDRAEVGDGEAIGDGSGWLVGCGRPHPGLTVTVLDEDEATLPPAHLGEIALAGPTVVDGYEGEAGGPSSFGREVLRTGDAGFLVDEELYVVGRIGDSLKVRGRSVYMEDIEAKLARIEGISRGRCVALAGSTAAGDCLVALVEAEPGPWVERAAAALTRAAGHESEVRVLQAERGTIQRTSSGKPRRRPMWQALVEGRLRARVVHRVTVRPRPGTPAPVRTLRQATPQAGAGGGR
jgi:fatty-acyl-CoA synthase